MFGLDETENNGELNRLLALKTVNENIRRDEIDTLEQMRECSLAHLSS